MKYLLIVLLPGLLFSCTVKEEKQESAEENLEKIKTLSNASVDLMKEIENSQKYNGKIVTLQGTLIFSQTSVTIDDENQMLLSIGGPAKMMTVYVSLDGKKNSININNLEKFNDSEVTIFDKKGKAYDFAQWPIIKAKCKITYPNGKYKAVIKDIKVIYEPKY